ncbi:MAG TPA: phytase [Allosphingosinicella sp.]|nr:phytase [Allosphingosinicella sp.]
MKLSRTHWPAIAACFLLPALATAQPAPPAPKTVAVTVRTQPMAPGEPNQAVIAAEPDRVRVIGTSELGGLESYDIAGARLGATPAGDVAGVDVRAGVPVAGGTATIVAATDNMDNRLRLFRLEGGALAEISARAIPLGFAAENVCLHRSGRDGALYAFVVGDGGEIDQLMLFATADGRMDARQVRRLSFPSPVTFCVADDRTGDLYVAHEATGIWRFDANPEADAAPAVIDVTRLGTVGEVGGLALFDGGEGARYLVAADVPTNRILFYDRADGHRLVGAATLTGPDGAVVEAPGGLFATSATLGNAFPNGALVVTDEGARRYDLVDFRGLATALGLNAGTAQGTAQPGPPPFPAVRARVETAAVPSSGDAADDPAIWAHPTDPARSLVIGTNKRAGLHVYDMAGRELQFVRDGKMNNVDLRSGFRLGGREVVLVTASNRTNFGIAIYALDTAAQRLTDVADGVQATNLSDPYGQCMYRSRRTGKTYVFVGDPDGLIRQWELIATRDGRVRTRQVREIRFSSQTEGCVADDETGTLWVGEEDVGLWRLNAEPTGPEDRRSVDRVESSTRIRDDIEGVGIYDLGGGRGYVVASSQGNDSYAVYRREGDNEYLGSFIVVADGARGIDGISETDGLEVTSRNLGPGFEHGAMIAQDGRNVLPTENQNFKYVAWADIAAALNLEVRR